MRRAAYKDFQFTLAHTDALPAEGLLSCRSGFLRNYVAARFREHVCSPTPDIADASACIRYVLQHRLDRADCENLLEALE